TSQNTQNVLEYNDTTGAFVKVAATGGALGDPLGVVVGLDGNLLVADGQTNQVKRYGKNTGAFINVFASTNLSAPRQAAPPSSARHRAMPRACSLLRPNLGARRGRCHRPG